MSAIRPARTLHEIYEQDFLPQRETGIPDWRTWLGAQWRKHIEFYAAHNWRMMPILARSKRPLQNRPNYKTENRKWPPLSVDDACKWASQDFNLGIVALRNLVWLDVDQPEKLPSWFLEAASSYLMMRTPRGLAVPVEQNAESRIADRNRLRKELGVEALRRYASHNWKLLVIEPAPPKLAGVDTIRRGTSYQLVPLSVTCTKDRGAKHRVNFGKHLCLDGKAHDLRVREWVDLSKPVMTARILRGLLKS